MMNKSRDELLRSFKEELRDELLRLLREEWNGMTQAQRADWLERHHLAAYLYSMSFDEIDSETIERMLAIATGTHKLRAA